MTPIEAVLRLTCNIALERSLSLPNAVVQYRSVATLARALRTEMADDGLPRGFAPDLLTLLIDVLNAICARALAPGMPPASTAILARAIGQLSTACHLARPVAEKAPKPAPKPAAAPKPVSALPAKPPYTIPAAIKPISPEDRALAERLIADMSRRAIQDHKRAA